MNTRISTLSILALIIPVTLTTTVEGAAPLGTAVTYQGQLKQGGAPVNGNLDMEFRLFDAATLGNKVGDPVTLNGVEVSNGLFTVTVNAAGEFGPSAFNGEDRWLAITVGGTPLTPRQELKPAPHALALPGLYTQQNATSPNIIGGYSGNNVGPFVFGATISGGGDAFSPNTVKGGYGTVGGGQGNTASGGGGPGECLCGPPFCFSDLECPGSCGDVPNRCLRGPTYTTVCGGGFNTASGQASAVVGGAYNTASGQVSTVGGGVSNTASGAWSTVPGGDSNEAGGDYSFAAGRQAHVRSTALGDLATDNGTFIWADNTNADFTSTGPNQFLIRASGGVGIGTESPTDPLTVNGVIRSMAGGIEFPDGTLQTTAATGGGGGTLDQAYDFGGPGAGRTITADSGVVEIAGPDGLRVAGTIQSGSSVTIDGTADSENIASSASLDLRVAAGRALRLEDNGSSSPNIIGGYSGNVVLEAAGATIGGGGAADDDFGNPFFNKVAGWFGTVGGGAGNVACKLGSLLGPPGTALATVAGGYRNAATGSYSSVGGGRENRASEWYATVGGGVQNIASDSYSTVGGGESNTASGFGATVPGGQDNVALGWYSFAAGKHAKANHDSTFVWADSTDADFTSTGPNQFLIRASGGVGINTNDPTATLHIGGAPSETNGIRFPDNTLQVTAATGGGWTDDGTVVRLATPTDLVGIGTDSPGAKLDVNGAARTTTLEIIGGSPPQQQQPQPLVGWGDNSYGQANVHVPPGTYTAVSGGRDHSLAIRSDGTLAGWGDNSDDQITVPAGTFIAVAAGNGYSLAIRSNGALAGWGSNSQGQINPLPAGTFTAVAAGNVHSLAIRTDGTLVGWGDNTYGTTTNIPAGTFTAVAAGYSHNLAIRDDGTLAGWGRNEYNVMTTVPAGMFTAVAAGFFNGLAIRTDGTLAAWGYSYGGPIPAGEFLDIAVGINHGLAIRSDGTLVAWGCGAPFDDGQCDVPAGTFSAVAAGWDHSLAIRSAQAPSVPGLRLQMDSAVKPGTNTWTIASDRRLKKNIEPLSGALERLLQLHGVTFQWLDPASQGGITGTQMGLIADEVQRAFPQWVGRDPKGYQTLTVGGFEALTAEALRELQTGHEAEIAALRGRIEALEAAIAARQSAP